MFKKKSDQSNIQGGIVHSKIWSTQRVYIPHNIYTVTFLEMLKKILNSIFKQINNGNI